MKSLHKIITLILILFVLQICSAPVFAQSYNFGKNSGLNLAAKEAGYETNKTDTIETSISKIIGIVLSVIGVIFLILIIYGGLTWMTAAGNEEKTRKAKELITEAFIGLIIVLAAYAITYFIVNQLISTTLSNNPAATLPPKS